MYFIYLTGWEIGNIISNQCSLNMIWSKLVSLASQLLYCISTERNPNIYRLHSAVYTGFLKTLATILMME